MKTIDTLIHINDDLDNTTKGKIENELKTLQGVEKSAFHKTKPHLLLVSYDTEKVSAHRLLHKVIEKGYKAELIGL